MAAYRYFRFLGLSQITDLGFLSPYYADFRLGFVLTMERNLSEHFDAIVQAYARAGGSDWEALFARMTSGLYQYGDSKGTFLRPRIGSLSTRLPVVAEGAIADEWKLVRRRQILGTAGKVIGGLGVAADVGFSVYDGVTHDDGTGMIIFDAVATAVGDVGVFASKPLLLLDLATAGGVSGSISNGIRYPVDSARVVFSSRWTPADTARVRQRWTRKPLLKGVWALGELAADADYNPVVWLFYGGFRLKDSLW